MADTAILAPPLAPEAVTLLNVLRAPEAPFEHESNELNWDFFVDLACRNHVALTVYRNRGHQALRGMPAGAAERLRETYLGMVQHGLLLATLWREVMPVLDGQGLRVLPYKGRALASALYGDPSARHTWDVDVLLESPDDAERAYEVLRARGFNLQLPDGSPSLADLLHDDCELTLIHERNAASIELHWRVLPHAFGDAGSAQFMWDHAAYGEVEGIRCWTADPAATLRMLLLHGGIKHEWFELRLAADIARWLETYPAKDVSRILSGIPAGRMRAKCAAGLLLANRLLGARIPDENVYRTHLGSAAMSNAAFALGRMFGPVARLPMLADWRAYMQWLNAPNVEGGPSAWRYVAALLAPEFDDVVALQGVPKMLRSVGLPLRAFRLAGKAVRIRFGGDGAGLANGNDRSAQ